MSKKNKEGLVLERLYDQICKDVPIPGLEEDGRATICETLHNAGFLNGEWEPDTEYQKVLKHVTEGGDPKFKEAFSYIRGNVAMLLNQAPIPNKK